MPRTAEARTGVASVRARAAGYAVDMVIFSAIAMLVVVAAGAQLLLVTHGATRDSDAAIYAFLAIIALATPLLWTGLNLFVLRLRAQTGGQYVAGVRLAREDRRRLSFLNAAAWWLCLNPLLFSWPMAIVVGLPLAFVISLLLSRVTIVAFGVVVILCVLAPVIALVSALIDDHNRTLHDRIVGTLVVPAE